MKYFEFGEDNKVTLLLLHGVDTTWQMSFSGFIEVAKQRYHVIAVAEDGFNPDEPEVDAVSVIAEAKKVSDYIVDRFDGKIDIILGESLGCMIMTEILLDDRIMVHTAIADGFTMKDKRYGLRRFMRYGYDHNPVTEESRIKVEKMHAGKTDAIRQAQNLPQTAS